MGRKSEVSPEERREIVLNVLRKEESTAALARKHDVAEASILVRVSQDCRHVQKVRI